MATDSTRLSSMLANANLPETIDSRPPVRISFRKNKQPGRKLSTNDIRNLAMDALVADLKRKSGAGRTALAVLELLGELHPDREQSPVLADTARVLLGNVDNVNINPRAALDNVCTAQPIQAAKKPSSDGGIPSCGQNFSNSGLTPARIEPDIEDEP